MGCGNSSAAPQNGTVWAELKQRLPLEKTPEHQKKRDILFAKFDVSKKQALTETDCLNGCKTHLELDKLTKDLAPINKRAFTAASTLRTRADATGGVDPAEFRLYLQYLRDYFELNVMFDEVDTSDDRVVTLAEFKQALPRIEKWGLKVANPEEEFKKVDKDGKGVTFDAFADWAIRNNLDAEKDAAAGAIPAAAPKDEGAPAQVKAAPAPAAAAPAAAAPAAAASEKKKEEATHAAPAAAPAHVEKKEEATHAAAPAAAPAHVEEKKEATHAAAHKDGDAPAQVKAAPAPAAAPAHVEEKKEATHAAAPAHVEEKKEATHAAAPAAAPAHVEEKKEATHAAAPAPAAAPAAPAADAAAKRKAAWTDLKARLPRKKDPAQNAARDELFKSFDPNGNGFLSYAEIERGCKNILKLNDFTQDLDPILLRAYNAARSARKGKGEASSDQDAFVERVEFRLLLVYIYDYFELWVVFDEIDSSDDLKVSIAEFKQALPALAKYGVKLEDPEAEFKSMDKNGGGSVTFAEFAEWAISKHLDADGEENQK